MIPPAFAFLFYNKKNCLKQLFKEKLKESKDSSIFLKHLAEIEPLSLLTSYYQMNPESKFGYTKHHVF
jgi:hypothetical protein